MTPPEIMFAQKIRLVFNNLILHKKKVEHTVKKKKKQEVNFTKWVKKILPNVSDG